MWTCNRLDLQINTRIDLNRLCPIQKSPRSLIPCRQLFDECLLWTMATWRRTWTMHILIAGVSPSSSSSSSSRRCMFNYTNWDWAGLGWAVQVAQQNACKCGKWTPIWVVWMWMDWLVEDPWFGRMLKRRGASTVSISQKLTSGLRGDAKLRKDALGWTQRRRPAESEQRSRIHWFSYEVMNNLVERKVVQYIS